MLLNDNWFLNQDVKIHYLDSYPNNRNTPFLICPGLSEPAENYVPLLSSLSSRRCIVFSFRGRGKSDSPERGYYLENHVSNKVKGLILAEYPAEHKKMPEGWADEYLASYWGDELGANLMKAHVVKGIEHDSRQVDFWNDLNKIKCPVLIMRGTEEESLLSDEQAKRYLKCLEPTEAYIEVFDGVGHTLKDSEPEKFVTVVSEFLEDVDNQQ